MDREKYKEEYMKLQIITLINYICYEMYENGKEAWEITPEAVAKETLVSQEFIEEYFYDTGFYSTQQCINDDMQREWNFDGCDCGE